MAAGIWDWVLSTYARPGVAEACLALQDEHGQNVCLLLWAAYARPRDTELLARAAAAAHAWDSAAVSPLRQVRRALKAAFPEVDADGRETLRTEVKALELDAERLLLEALERLCGETISARTGDAPALEALEGASRAWGASPPAAALAALAAAFD